MCLYDPLSLQLSQLISAITPGDLNMCQFCPSGSEAVDNAIRISRYYTKKKKIISIKNGFHGRTMGVVALTSNCIPLRSSIEPLVDLCISDNELEQLIRIVETTQGKDIAAVIIEPIQGEGGVYKIDIGSMQELRCLCKKYNILYISDDIQCGLCRTGSMFGFQHSGIIPDIILLAKGIANGLPLAAVVSTPEIFNACPVGGLGGTYGGNALSVAAAKEVINIMLEQKLHLKTRDDELYIKTMLDEIKKQEIGLLNSRVHGLMIGMDFMENVDKLIQKCEQNRLLVLPTNNPKTIRLLPSLNITKKELDIGLGRLYYSIKECNPPIYI